MTNTNEKKEMIKDFIYFAKFKVKLPYMDNANQKAFLEIEKEFFNSNEINNLSFKQFNTIAFIIGDYVENKQYRVYENDIINKCIEVLEA